MKWIALILVGLLVVAGLVFGLSSTVVQIEYDDEIDRRLRLQMQTNNLMLLHALRDEEYDVIPSFFGRKPELDKIRAELPAVREQMADLIEAAEFENFHDHYVTGAKEVDFVPSAHALSEAPGSYIVQLDVDAENAYVSLYTSEVDQSEALYTIVWGEYADGWKIHNLDVANFGWSGKRGPDWFEAAEKVRQQSGDIAAFLMLKAVSGLFRPSQLFAWKDLEARVIDLYGELAASIASKLSQPIVVQELESKPTIYGLDATTVADLPGQIIPTIQYVSKFQHSEADLVSEEANRMAPHMEKYFEGVNDLGANLLFAAYEEPPTDPKKQYKLYRTVVEIR